MPSEKDLLGRALGRLGRVPPEVLRLSRQRVRGNLKIDLRLTARLPSPYATPADLTALRRPFYIGGAMAMLCLFLVGGVVVRWRIESRSAASPGGENRFDADFGIPSLVSITALRYSGPTPGNLRPSETEQNAGIQGSSAITSDRSTGGPGPPAAGAIYSVASWRR